MAFLVGCAAPSDVLPAADSGSSETEPDEARPAEAPPEANASAARVKEGVFRITLGADAGPGPSLAFVSGERPELKVAQNDRVTGRAEWSAGSPAAANLVLRLTEGTEIFQEISGPSPLEVEWIPAAGPERTILVTVAPAEPSVVVQQDIALTMTVALANV